MKRLLILLVVCLLAACQPTVVEPDYYTIGVSVPLSGSAAVYGEDFMVGVDKALAELNAGEQRIEIFAVDNQNNPRVATNGYQELLLRDVDVVLSTMSGASTAIAPLTKRDGIPLVTSIAFADLTEYDNVYQYFYRPDEIASATVQYLLDEEILYVGLLGIDIEASHAFFDILEPALVEAGLEIVVSEFYLDGTDQRTVIEKVIEHQPEAIFAWDIRPDTVVDDLKQVYDGPILLGDSPVGTGLFVDPVFDGTYVTAPLYMISDTSENTFFMGLFGDAQMVPAAWGYETIHLIWTAQALGELPDGFAQIGEYVGMNGRIDLASSRKPGLPMQMVKVEDGKLVALYN